MDLVLARTFLAIVDVGNFAKAAERLYVTQSTVSTRVKILEDLVGQQLFVRLKSGTKLTPAGTHFRPYAEKLLQTWEHARMEVGLPDAFRKMLAVGAEFTLWERLLTRWLPWIRTALPDVAVRVGVGSSAHLMQQLVDGLIELAVTYTPQYRSGLVVEKLMEERLVLISRDRESKGVDAEDYIYVDWGPEFRIEHTEAFPDRMPPVVSVDYGPLALRHIVVNGGAAYLPVRMVRRYLDSGDVHILDGAPEFSRTVFTAHPESEDGERFNTAIQGLRYVASLESEE